MIKIALIQNNILPYRVQLWNLLASIPEVDFTVYHSGEQVGKEESINFEEKKLKKIKFKGFTCILGLNRIINSYDLVIFPFDFHFLNIFSPFLNRQKIALFGHGLGKKKHLNFLRFWLIAKFPRTILYSQKVKEDLIKSGVDRDKLRVLKNTIINYNYGNDDIDRRDFLYVGRLQKRKQIDLIIKSFSNIINKIPYQTKLIIVGGDKENIKEYLEKLTIKLGIGSRVNFLGEVNEEEKLKIIFNKSIAYLCPINGGLGIVHSFSYGTPLIIKEGYNYHGPEYENIIKDDNAIVFKSIIEMEKAMVLLASDKSLRKRLSRNSYSYYKNNFSPETYVKSFLEIVKEIVKV